VIGIEWGMPRWETRTPKQESFLELVLDGDRVWVAAGRRDPGATEWSVEHSHPTCYRLNAGPAAAQAEYDKRIAKLPKKAVLVGDATPVISPVRETRDAEAAELRESMKAWEAEHGLVARLRAEGSVRLVGAKASTEGEYFEVAIEGTTVVTRRGKLTGGKPKTERQEEPDLERALTAAQITLMSTIGIRGFKA
jgi:hypothetical protein